MKRVLVVYCSRSGHTATVARQIAAQCNADIEALEGGSVVARLGPVGYVRSALEALLGIEPSMRPSRHSPKAYDLVIVGTPVWFWNMASPVRAYLAHHRGELREVAFFCTQGGSGAQKVFADLRKLCRKPPVATLALTTEQVETKQGGEALAKFIGALRPAQPAAAVKKPLRLVA